MVENDSDYEMIPNPNPKKPGRAKQTAGDTDELFNYYDKPEWDEENVSDNLIGDCDEDIENPPYEGDSSLKQCMEDDESEVDGKEDDNADEIKASEIVSGDSFSRAIHKVGFPKQ
ncbi:uncharacterized protein MELLADRAFT_107062 [Melampsora larici-populina 98AG31]|uniref:Uncharacterized protein n=1 Tax=Melampsora larici-populina (strain 98AG31 / pathotype 3-4-7) TaxID=747676 RepID=F4RNJ4_MELLP|nr:uncharacterized protein MELLADRAFT_107062 [Melampsora larici-populina 98AG31]EGG05998.1 hypothetical protein MELLADRAFT_107062 [Melampsora larici-populina 98AG31]